MSTTNSPDRRMDYFQMLTRDEQRVAIRRMAASGQSEFTIAAATRLSVEMIRKILGPTEPAK
jgi:hypothetical protein